MKTTKFRLKLLYSLQKANYFSLTHTETVIVQEERMEIQSLIEFLEIMPVAKT